MAATSTREQLFLAPQRSVLALFQKLRDEKKLVFPVGDGTETRFIATKNSKPVPSIEFFHSKLIDDATELKARLAPGPTSEMHAEEIPPVTGEYVPIEFKTLIFIWYMLTLYNVHKDVDAVIAVMNLTDADVSHIDLFNFFDIPTRGEDDVWPLQVRDLFSIVMDSFFITRLPFKSINVLLINAKSPVIKEYEGARETPLLIEGYCVSYNDDGPYLMDLYGAFIKSYINAFMFHYGDIWSITKGRYV